MFYLIRWHGFIVNIALELLAFTLSKEIKLSVRFHSFGDNIHVKALGQDDNSLDNGFVLVTDIDPMDKRHGDLDSVDRQGLDVV
jgi:hypothetical protein